MIAAERVGEVLYRYDKIESQIRLLADTLFLCKVSVRGSVSHPGLRRLTRGPRRRTTSQR